MGPSRLFSRVGLLSSPHDCDLGSIVGSSLAEQIGSGVAEIGGQALPSNKDAHKCRPCRPMWDPPPARALCLPAARSRRAAFWRLLSPTPQCLATRLRPDGSLPYPWPPHPSATTNKWPPSVEMPEVLVLRQTFQRGETKTAASRCPPVQWGRVDDRCRRLFRRIRSQCAPHDSTQSNNQGE